LNETRLGDSFQMTRNMFWTKSYIKEYQEAWSW